MEHRLAGQHSGDRRRRRMSSDLQDEELFHEFFPEAALARETSSVTITVSAEHNRLLRRLISPRLWKHVVLLIVGAIGIAVVLWWQQLPNAFAKLASQSVSDDAIANNLTSVSPGLTGLLLLLSGQLALCTGLLRSTSLVDFQGRYRWWKWLAAGLIAAAIVVTTDTTSQVSHVLVSLLQPVTGQIQAAKQTLLLVPALTFCMIVLGRILPDMSRSLPSLSLLMLAVLTFTARLLLMHSDAANQVSVAALQIMQLSAAYTLFAAMLLHCRFVAYVCQDPPETVIKQSQKHGPVAETEVNQTEATLAASDAELAVPMEAPAPSKSTTKKKSKSPARKSRRAA